MQQWKIHITIPDGAPDFVRVEIASTGQKPRALVTAMRDLALQLLEAIDTFAFSGDEDAGLREMTAWCALCDERLTAKVETLAEFRDLASVTGWVLETNAGMRLNPHDLCPTCAGTRIN